MNLFVKNTWKGKGVIARMHVYSAGRLRSQFTEHGQMAKTTEKS